MSKSNRGTTSEREALRRACFKTWGKSCMYCGDKATEVDHIIELDAGGSNTLDNLQPLCVECHKAKTAAYNSRRQRTQSHTGFFRGEPAPIDSFVSISPRLRRFDPPMANNKG